MNLSSNKNSQFILLIAFIAALLFAVYYYLVLPKQGEVDSLNRSVQALETEIAAIQTNTSQAETEDNKSTTNLFKLRQQVPQTREVDKLLLNFEEISYVTDSHILSIDIDNYDSLASEAGLDLNTPEGTSTDSSAITETKEQNSINSGIQTSEGQTVTDSVPTVSNIISTLPPELKIITFSLEVESSDYKHLLQFIDELENLERIIRIDTIKYSLLGEEAKFVKEESDTVFASIQVTTFYYDGE